MCKQSVADDRRLAQVLSSDEMTNINDFFQLDSNQDVLDDDTAGVWFAIARERYEWLKRVYNPLAPCFSLLAPITGSSYC